MVFFRTSVEKRKRYEMSDTTKNDKVEVLMENYSEIVRYL